MDYKVLAKTCLSFPPFFSERLTSAPTSFVFSRHLMQRVNVVVIDER